MTTSSKYSTIILTVLDYPNDNYTFISEKHPNADYLTSGDILTILAGLDTCGDNVYLGALEMRYFDGHSFVARSNNADHTYNQITGMVSRCV